MDKTNILVLTKTSFEDEDEGRLQDVFKTSSSRRMFAGLSPFLCCNGVVSHQKILKVRASL